MVQCSRTQHEAVHDHPRTRPRRASLRRDRSGSAWLHLAKRYRRGSDSQRKEAIGGHIAALKATCEPVPEETERPQAITIDVAA